MKIMFNNTKEFNATIAITTELYQRVEDYRKLTPQIPNAGISVSKYLWMEYTDPTEFYRNIIEVAKLFESLNYGNPDNNVCIVECNGYAYNLSRLSDMNNFIYDFEKWQKK